MDGKGDLFLTIEYQLIKRAEMKKSHVSKTRSISYTQGYDQRLRVRKAQRLSGWNPVSIKELESGAAKGSGLRSRGGSLDLISGQ